MGILDFFGKPEKRESKRISYYASATRSNRIRSPRLNGGGQRQFEAAIPDRTNASWRGASPSINNEIKFSLRQLRAKCRDLAQNDPYIKKYLRTCKKYIIGPEGFTIKNKSFEVAKDEEGRWYKKFNVEENNLIEENFWDWSKKKTCTIEQDSSFRQFLNTVLTTKKTDGEVFIKKIYPNKAKNPFCYTLQAIEAHMVDETLNGPLDNGNFICMGIEYNQDMTKQAYYFRKIDRNVDPTLKYYSKSYIRVPADEIIHYYTKEYVGQLRGYPDFVQVINRIKTLKGYEEAALINARSAAMKTLVLKYSNTQPGDLRTANIAGAQKKDDNSIEYYMEAGQVYVVPRGMEPYDYNPAFPQAEHSAFTENMMFSVASGMDRDYPTISSNLKSTNYTSIRHGMKDTQVGDKLEQADIREDIIEPVFSDVLLYSILSGKLMLDVRKYDTYNKPKIIGYTPDWVDPLKDGRAKIEGLQAMTESLEDILAEKGKDLEEHLDQIAYEKREREKRGLTPPDITGWPEVKTDEENQNNGDKKDARN